MYPHPEAITTIFPLDFFKYEEAKKVQYTDPQKFMSCGEKKKEKETITKISRRHIFFT